MRNEDPVKARSFRLQVKPFVCSPGSSLRRCLTHILALVLKRHLAVWLTKPVRIRKPPNIEQSFSVCISAAED